MGDNTIAYLSGLKDELSQSSNNPAIQPDPPSLVQTNAGDTVLGDVSVALSTPEKNLVANNPEFFRKLLAFVSRYKWVVWPIVFLAFLYVAGLGKKK